MNASTKREQRAWERKATSRRQARRAELRAWGKALGLVVLIAVTGILIVMAGLSTI